MIAALQGVASIFHEPSGMCRGEVLAQREDALKEERKGPAGRPAGEPGLVSACSCEQLPSPCSLQGQASSPSRSPSMLDRNGGGKARNEQNLA